MAKLVLVRHGQSIYNKENKFAGWLDISLTKKGLEQAKLSGELLKDIKFDFAFTSKLSRAQQTLFEIIRKNKFTDNFIIIHEDNFKYSKNFKPEKNILQVFESQKLNERFYGDFQSLNKVSIIKKLGKTLLKKLRRGYREKISFQNFSYETLLETHKRVSFFFSRRVLKKLKENQNILIVAHGNSLRALIKIIENISDDKICDVEIDLAKPLIYDFDKNLKLKNNYYN